VPFSPASHLPLWVIPSGSLRAKAVPSVFVCKAIRGAIGFESSGRQVRSCRHGIDRSGQRLRTCRRTRVALGRSRSQFEVLPGTVPLRPSRDLWLAVTVRPRRMRDGLCDGCCSGAACGSSPVKTYRRECVHLAAALQRTAEDNLRRDADRKLPSVDARSFFCGRSDSVSSCDSIWTSRLARSLNTNSLCFAKF